LKNDTNSFCFQQFTLPLPKKIFADVCIDSLVVSKGGSFVIL
jgi:hypothetical protein